ncbi:MAG: DUF1592 domain-containing protein [Myxococcota bacterium]
MGSIGSDGGGGANGPGASPAPGTDPSDPRLEARVWRLSPEQYNTEIQRLFPGAPPVSLTPGASEFGLSNIASTARIDTGNASQYVEGARSIANWVVDQGASAARCDEFGTDACVNTYLDWAVEAAFRRPVSQMEKADLRAVYDSNVEDYGADWAFGAMTRAMLTSPSFLYRTEIGADGVTGVFPIDGHEIANLLSFTLTGHGADETLLADAANLQDADVRERHVRRLMPEAAPVFQQFLWQWLHMSTLESQGNETGLEPALVAALEQEFEDFVANIVVEQRGTVGDLLTSTSTWATPEVASYYEVNHPGDGVAEIALNPDQRSGLLTLGAWLVAHGKRGRANVVRRGMNVFIEAMCNGITPIDIDLEAALDDLVGPDATVKEIVEARAVDPSCGGCHSTADPVGLAFEHFRGDGTWQDTYEDGNPVEVEVTVAGQEYSGAISVSAALAEDDSFRQCLVQRFGHFVMGHEFGDPLTVRASSEALAAFDDSGGAFEELLVAIIRDPAFIERRRN